MDPDAALDEVIEKYAINFGELGSVGSLQLPDLFGSELPKLIRIVIIALRVSPLIQDQPNPKESGHER
ncbi:hypothetical protein [Fimbriiglobus ruber]|uniref:hypothetical protein n=1 Tax=Fimbriiglobus ruber TaxID=1908690 RepID=UPI00137987A0|nr:hypothetical protein [Fimbriiglobus ruber]